MKNSAKLTAIQDILMDAEYQESKKQGQISGMGVVTPGKTKFEQFVKTKKKQNEKV